LPGFEPETKRPAACYSNIPTSACATRHARCSRGFRACGAGRIRPASLLEWLEFHQRVEALPEQEREVFDLLWYEDMKQKEASEVLGVKLRTLKRRWQSARLILARTMREDANGQP
jgi:DNA-directed RNA polymerase specialized sigma24 family protein